MTTGPETRLQRRIQRELTKRYGTDLWVFKVHGGWFQENGIPDIIGCLHGRFFALEVKLPEEKWGLTDLQRAQLDRLEQAGGTVAVVRSVEEALDVLDLIGRHDPV